MVASASAQCGARRRECAQRHIRERVARFWLALGFTAAACLSGHALAGAQDAGPFSVTGPNLLVLGQDTETTLHIKAPSAAQFHLYANVGQLGTASRVGTGEWQVKYTLPTQRYPQVGVIALISDDGLHFAWTRIALHGSARVEIQSEPEVLVEVRVGHAEFGPTTTDRAGHAQLPVVVPPGNTTAVSVATDALGNQKEQTISLGVPAFRRLLAVCPARQPLAFWVFAIDEQGLPQLDAQLQASGPELRTTGIIKVAPGVYRLEFEAGPNMRAGSTVRLSASLSSDASVADGCASVLPARARAPVASTLAVENAPRDATPFGHKRFLLGAQAGYVTNFAKLHAPQLSLRAGLRLPFAGEHLSLELQGSFHASQHVGPSSDGIETIHTHVSAVPILFRAAYTLRLQRLDVWLFAGGGALFAKTEVTGPLLGQARTSATVAAYAAGSGVGLALGPGHLGLELSYMQARIDTRLVNGNLAGFSSELGYGLEL